MTTNTNSVKVVHSYQDDLTEEQKEQYIKRLDSATISHEAWEVFDQMRILELDNILNIPFDPEKPVVYATTIAETRAKLLLLSQIMNSFNGKTR